MDLCIDEIHKLQAAIRKHRDTRGDDRCFQDDAELYSVLPEGDTRPASETAVTIENCQRYIECRQQGREYVSPQRRIEELEAELTRIRNQPPINTTDYRNAPSGIGPQADTWKDKPHRLVYDLCTEIERLRAEIATLKNELDKCEGCSL